jgi:hypothetical protein
MEKGPRKAIDAVWRRQERKHGVRVAPELRRMVEERYLTGLHDSDVELEDFEQGVEGFVQQELPAIIAFVKTQAASPRAESLPVPVKLRARARTYRKPFERRLHILGFVASSVVPFPYLLQRSLDTAGRRIGWKRLVGEWNQAHPHDPFTSETLRVAYYRASREQYLCESYFDQKFREWAKLDDELGLTLKVLLAAHDHGVEGTPGPQDIFAAFHEGQLVLTERTQPTPYKPLGVMLRYKCLLLSHEAGWPRGEALCSEGRCNTCDVWSRLRSLTPSGGVWLFHLPVGKGGCLASAIAHPTSSAPSPPPREFCVGHIPAPASGKWAQVAIMPFR